MHLHLPHLTWSGPAIDDPLIIEALPDEWAAALRERNGCLAYRGAVHFRGACREPSWHSLRGAMDGPDALHSLYPHVRQDDVPIAENAFGDQFLLRDGRVLQLEGETGVVRPAFGSLTLLLDALIADADAVLGFDPAAVVAAIGGELQPGMLISAYPPFVTEEARDGVDLRPIPAIERRRWLADLAAQLRSLPDGSRIAPRVVP